MLRIRVVGLSKMSWLSVSSRWMAHGGMPCFDLKGEVVGLFGLGVAWRRGGVVRVLCMCQDICGVFGL